MIHPGAYLWGGAIGIALLSLHLTTGFSERLDQKFRTVKKTVESAQTFRQRLDNLRHVNSKFTETYPDGKVNNDLYSLYRLTGVGEAGGTGEPEKLMITRMKSVRVDDQNVGATEFSLAMSGAGYGVSAPDLAMGLRIATEMLSKPYVQADQVTFKLSPGSRTTMVVFTNYTVTLRDPAPVTSGGAP